ncbi:hypothetical protein [Moorena sp. SIO3I6]|uniref:hypothetical protein n=1 Tax=Moorena sp. SIO3I6 TaxID=2607831 RepID=UPI0013FAAFDA|nr:hypothetical protein [Moorena sp. SIO3I6]NEP20953.1 hypothetical protein [Moorena sp. SIO3I6]
MRSLLAEASLHREAEAEGHIAFFTPVFLPISRLSRHPTPYTLLPTPYSLLPTPYTLLPTPYPLTNRKVQEIIFL